MGGTVGSNKPYQQAVEKVRDARGSGRRRPRNAATVNVQPHGIQPLVRMTDDRGGSMGGSGAAGTSFSVEVPGVGEGAVGTQLTPLLTQSQPYFQYSSMTAHDRMRGIDGSRINDDRL